MALLEILHFPDVRLRIKAAPVTEFNKALHQLIDDMYETMYEANGVGLAGTQVNIHQQIFVMDASEKHNKPMCVINPEIVHREGVLGHEGEGCLSVPSAYDKVKRAAKVRLRGVDMHGKPFELDAEDLLAHIIQHECDHLQGKLFIDYLSRLKFERLKAKLKKRQP